MKRLYVLLLINIMACACVFAQKKEIAQAQTYIKSGKNLDKAEADMRKLLNDSTNRKNMKAWQALTEAIRMQYEQGNEKLYLKQQYDTASLFLTNHRMFLAYEAMDSIDALPNKKGKIEPKFRKRNATYLNEYRLNLYNGGVFFISKQKYSTAFSMLDAYIDCANQPLFKSFAYKKDSKHSLSAAYLATLCGVKLSDNAMALKHAKAALLYKPGREKTLQSLANIYDNMKDTLLYKQTLKQGIEEYPKSEYFFTRLVDYYNNTNKLDSALYIVDKCIGKDSLNILFLYAKSSIMLNTGHYDNCITISDKIISLNDSTADAYYNAGVAFLNKAFEAEKNATKRNKSMITKYYKNSLGYMERYRGLAPDQKEKWAPVLYNIYLNLNMGKKFEEITKILQQ